MPASRGSKAMAMKPRWCERRTMIKFCPGQKNHRTEGGTDMEGKMMRVLNSMKRLANVSMMVTYRGTVASGRLYFSLVRRTMMLGRQRLRSSYRCRHRVGQNWAAVRFFNNRIAIVVLESVSIEWQRRRSAAASKSLSEQ